MIILNQISYIFGRFSADGVYLVARDYLNVHTWDTRMDREPVSIASVHPAVEPFMEQLCDTDTIFDRFAVGVSPDGENYITGSYKWVLIYSMTFLYIIYFPLSLYDY